MGGKALSSASQLRLAPSKRAVICLDSNLLLITRSLAAGSNPGSLLLRVTRLSPASVMEAKQRNKKTETRVFTPHFSAHIAR